MFTDSTRVIGMVACLALVGMALTACCHQKLSTTSQAPAVDEHQPIGSFEQEFEGFVHAGDELQAAKRAYRFYQVPVKESPDRWVSVIRNDALPASVRTGAAVLLFRRFVKPEMTLSQIERVCRMRLWISDAEVGTTSPSGGNHLTEVVGLHLLEAEYVINFPKQRHVESLVGAQSCVAVFRLSQRLDLEQIRRALCGQETDDDTGIVYIYSPDLEGGRIYFGLSMLHWDTPTDKWVWEAR